MDIIKTSAITTLLRQQKCQGLFFSSKGATDAEFAQRMLEIKHLLKFCLIPTSSMTPVALKRFPGGQLFSGFFFLDDNLGRLINHDALLHLS